MRVNSLQLLMGGVTESVMVLRSPQGMCPDLGTKHICPIVSEGVCQTYRKWELGIKCAVGMPRQVVPPHCGARETLRPNPQSTLRRQTAKTRRDCVSGGSWGCRD